MSVASTFHPKFYRNYNKCYNSKPMINFCKQVVERLCTDIFTQFLKETQLLDYQPLVNGITRVGRPWLLVTWGHVSYLPTAALTVKRSSHLSSCCLLKKKKKNHA